MVQQATTRGLYGGPFPFQTAGVFMNAMLFQLSLPGPIAQDFVPPLPSQQCQATDQGVSIVVQVIDTNGNPVNMRVASPLRIIVVRPSGNIAEVPANLYTNGLDGQIFFETGATTPYGAGLNEAGTWQVQGKFTISGETIFTTIGAFMVLANLGA